MQTLSLKDVAIDVIKHLPDTCSLEEIMYQINITAQVLEGIEDEKNGNVLSTEELLNQVKGWQQK